MKIKNLKFKIPAIGEARHRRLNLKFRCRYATTILYIFLIAVSLHYIKYSVLAQSTSSSASNSTQEQIQDKQEQIEDLQKKADSYRQMIEMQQNKGQTLQNQISLMEGQISSLEIEVQKLQEEIDKTSGEIGTLEAQIEIKKQNITEQKKILGQLVQAYYEDDQDNLLEMLLKNLNFSEFLNQTEYISQTGVKVEKVLTAINDAKNQLDSEKKQLELKNDQQMEKKGKVNERKINIDNEQTSKEQLLAETQGEEQKYQQLLERVEQQKQELLGDLSEISQEKSSELAAVEATLEKPKSGLASTSWYFSQRDSRWGDQHIGFSNTLMKSYGCAVTAVAMVFRFHGIDINPGTLAQQPIFYHDLIVWPKSWKGIELASSTGHGNIDWNVVDSELKNKNPVIVFVKATNRGAGHYVVIHGKDKNGEYVVHDPYWGGNIFLSSTRAYVSALYGGGTAVDQMIIYH